MALRSHHERDSGVTVGVSSLRAAGVRDMMAQGGAATAGLCRH